MDEGELKQRTKMFSLRVLKLTGALPKTVDGRAVAQQLVRCGMSVGANYRSVCRARSKTESRSRLAIVEEEADESAFWLEIIVESEMLKSERVEPLLREANELVAIMASSIQTSRRGGAQQSIIPNPKSKMENYA